MKVGNRVLKDQVLNHKDAEGIVTKITKEHTIIQWDNINGEWHYRSDQLKDIKVLDGGHKK